MWVEFIVPSGLIIGCIHIELIVVNSVIMPLTAFVEDIHLLGVLVGIDHVKVQALILLEEGAPRCSTPVVVLGDWKDLVNWHIVGINTAEGESVELQQFCLRIQLHTNNKVLGSESTLNEEGKERETLGPAISVGELARESRITLHLKSKLFQSHLIRLIRVFLLIIFLLGSSNSCSMTDLVKCFKFR